MGLALARKLVLKQGWSATAYQILNPGLKLWFSQDNEAVIGYFDWGRVRVTAGAPVCSEENLSKVVAEFEKNTADWDGACICYFAAGERLEGLLGGVPGYCQVLLGAQPVWHPNSWQGIVAAHASLRAQLSRARNKAVSIRLWPPLEVASHPGIRLCLKEWLMDRPMPAMHFLVEPQILERLWDRRIFVAERLGAPVAFLVATPIPARKGWLVEQIVQGRLAPNGTAELLIDAAFQQANVEGLEYFTLGLSPLSQALPEQVWQPWWISFTFQWLRMHGSRYYDFRGLESFKSKFIPDKWEPIYAICNQPKMTPWVMLAIAAVFGGGRPSLFVAKALLKALRQESVWLFKLLRVLWMPCAK